MGRSVVVVGEAGVGKTHLVDEALAGVVPRPRGDDAPSPGLVTISASSLGSDAPLASLHPRLAALPVVWEERGPGAASLGRTSGRMDAEPLLVRVEDAHLLDRTSAQTLTHLVRQGQVVLVATLRTAAAGTSPWLPLWKDDVADRIDLHPFTSAEVDTLLTEALGGPMTLDTSNRIWAATCGNAFFLRELVRTELDEGLLVAKGGVWVGLGGGEPGRRVVDVVRSDVARLRPAVREALELVALAEPVRVSRLVGMVAEGALDALAQEGLISIGHGAGLAETLTPVVRIVQPMYGEVLRRIVPLDRRRRLYAVMASARATASGGFTRETPGTLLRSVVWGLECGIRETSERLREAMAIATAQDEPGITVQIGAVALDELPPRHPDRADVLLLRAEAWRLLDQPARALRDLADVPQYLGELETDKDRERLIQLAAMQADIDQYHRDDVDGALAEIDGLRARLPGATGADGRPVLEVVRLVHLGRAGRFAESLEPSLELLRSADHPSVDVLRLANPVIFGLGQVGRFGEAVQLATQACRAATAHTAEAPWLTAEIEIAQFVAHLWSGQVQEAAALVRPGNPSWARVKASDAFGNLGLGLAAAAHGRWSDALREHHAASARYAVLDPAGVAAYALAAEAHAAAATGDVPTARGLIEAALSTPLRMSAVIESDFRLHLVDAMAWLGHAGLHGEAVRLARWSAERGLCRTELEALHRAVLAGHLRGGTHPSDTVALARMQELGARTDAPRLRALVAHAEAIVAGDGQLMQIASRDLGRCGLWLPGAGAGASSVLTRREREIAGLAAGGLSSRAIAERLTVSVRTVDSHLSRVFTKLGVRSRHELGASLNAHT